MGLKIVFIGNPFGGDDGIGPFLYGELKADERLRGFDMQELGVIGFDLINYVGDEDSLVIIDAIKSERDIGRVNVLDEDDLSKDLVVVSQHDFGVEQTAAILRALRPDMKRIKLIGVNVRDINAFSDKLSDEILQKMPEIKEEVIRNITSLADEDA